VREGDLLARYGGEEFVLLLQNANTDFAHRIAGRLLQLVDELRIPQAQGSMHPFVSVSIGMATNLDAQGQPTSELGAVLAIADLALYRAKQAGRRRIETATWS
jgi:diguanylate cyclase (GGDEF)-like protein